MKLSFSLKKTEASLEADVEKLIEKGMDQWERNPNRKTRYQIKQEEKRKNAELKHKQEMQKILIGVCILAACMIVAIIFGVLESLGILS